MSINPTPPLRGQSEWAVYLVAPDITITSWYVDTRQGRLFVAELEHVVRRITNVYALTVAGAAVGLVEFLMALPMAIFFGSPLLLGVGGSAALTMLTAVLVDARRNPRRMELIAVYRGKRVVLYTSSVHMEFERVRRAMIRALEVSRQPRP